MATSDKIAELRDNGFCVLHGHFARSLVDATAEAFRPRLRDFIGQHAHEPNRGAHRHFLPMPFTPPYFVPDFFFDEEVLHIVQSAIGDRIVADQWG